MKNALIQTLANVTASLLQSRNPAGHWEGELSSSALSTATAAFALTLYERSIPEGIIDNSRRDQLRAVARRGIDWLCAHQNADGGWGDTVVSLSNISTTALCWAALSVGGESAAGAMQKAAMWLERAAGSLEPAKLAMAVKARYGKDQTFSVPILTMCALAGRLGHGRDAWRLVPQLPFELAACPYQWFQWLRLPVVSYALPALIAIGQVRHANRPTWFLPARLLRRLTRSRTLRVLREIQPTGGGFLEATPLTSFVLMSLAGSGNAGHFVATNAVDFLIRSIRADGSWPIDTNLSTWLTTLSINALAPYPDFDRLLSLEDRTTLRHWLLGQQYRVEHPYTHAAPGAWAWTDLPGGVPDADDTAGALIALWNLGFRDAEVLDAVTAGVCWLLDLQNRDGGIPTFCRGWGTLPFDRSGSDLTAHALHAWALWRPDLPPALQSRMDKAADRARAFLWKQQRPDGSWVPLWFGNQYAVDDENCTYGTARVLIALCAGDVPTRNPATLLAGQRAARFLLQSQNADGGWGGGEKSPSSIEETSLAVQALATYAKSIKEANPDHGGGSLVAWASRPCPVLPGTIQRIKDTDGTPVPRNFGCDDDLDSFIEPIRKALHWLDNQTRHGTQFPPSPIGFYFAKLWYFERHYPTVFCCAALSQSTATFGEIT